MDYLDFEVEIDALEESKGVSPVRAHSSSAGEARGTMCFPFDKQALEKQLLALQYVLLHVGDTRHLQVLPPDEQVVPDKQMVERFGRELFNALFLDNVKTLYGMTWQAANDQDKGVRLKLRIQAPELAVVPWEFLYDPDVVSDFISLSNRIPIVRYLEVLKAPQPLHVSPPLSILVMTSSPKDLPKLDTESEHMHLETALQYAQTNGMVKIHWLSGKTWQDLREAMLTGPWHIFHFIGHGDFDSETGEGLIALEDDEGNAQRVKATALATLLADHSALRLVVLNSCEGAEGSDRAVFSSTASILVRRGLPAVLAMQFAITDQAAIIFSRTFYGMLARGFPVDMALSEARKAISIDSLEWGAPVLYTRSPDGVLFDVDQTLLRGENQAVAKEKEFAWTATLTGHSGAVNYVAISPAGQTLVSASADRTVRVWNLQSRELLHTLMGHESTVDCVAISPNGQLVVSGSADRTVRVWNLQSGELLHTLIGHKGSVRCVAISPDGQTLISGSADKTVRVWNLQSGVLVRTLIGHQGWLMGVESVAISPNGRILVSAGADKAIRVWNLQSGESLRSLMGHESTVNCVAISPDGQTMVSASADKTVRVWNLQSGESLYSLQDHVGHLTTSHHASVNSVVIGPNGELLASGSDDKTIKIWRKR